MWARSQGTDLNLDHPLESEVLVLSNAANFNYWIKRARQPVVLDLVDGYLGEHPPFIKDVARNILRSLRGTSDLRWITYTKHLREACRKSTAVIVASKEQRDVIQKYNKNVFVILDDHTELESESLREPANANESNQGNIPGALFWEGFGYTLKFFQDIAKELDQFLLESGWSMYLLTSEKFPRWGGYLGTVQTHKLIAKWFPLSSNKIQIIPWTVENVVRYAGISTLGLIPVDTNDKFATLKPENKLLSMWRLGLPVLFSNTPAYSRVARESNQEEACLKSDEWFTALKTLSQSKGDLQKLRDLGMGFISTHHTHDILVGKWSQTLAEVREIGPIE